MCGRFVAERSPASYAGALGVAELPERVLPPNYNVAPTQEVYIARVPDSGDRCLDIARWGLIPSWAKDPSIGNRMINARSETVAEKPAYRSSFASRRCLVPADGFYEWQAREGARKQPYYLRPADGSVLVMAGLYAWWRDKSVVDDDDPAAWVLSTTLLTTSADGQVAGIHDRSPVPVAPSLFAAWLDPQVPGGDILPEVLSPPPGDYWDVYPVSTAVNSPRNNSVDNLRALSSSGELG
jgi:putative SOS response-associated peptidase YedK